MMAFPVIRLRWAILTALAAFAYLTLTACKTTERVGLPAKADIEAVTVAKPKPSAAILTDPAADARYNSAVEGWGDGVSAAGGRLCRFFKAQGMDVTCPAPSDHVSPSGDEH